MLAAEGQSRERWAVAGQVMYTLVAAQAGKGASRLRPSDFNPWAKGETDPLPPDQAWAALEAVFTSGQIASCSR